MGNMVCVLVQSLHHPTVFQPADMPKKMRMNQHKEEPDNMEKTLIKPVLQDNAASTEQKTVALGSLSIFHYQIFIINFWF